MLIILYYTTVNYGAIIIVVHKKEPYEMENISAKTIMHMTLYMAINIICNYM